MSSEQRRTLNAKQQRTFDAIFTRPTRSNIPWKDIESLVRALGGRISEGRGSRVRILLNDRVGVFHRPHGAHPTVEGAVEDMRKLLEPAEKNQP